MPYFVNTFRIPKPGKFTAVAKGTEGSLKATGKFGFVSIPVAPRMPTAQSLAVIGTVTGFETLDDVDAFVDALVADDYAGFAARDDLSAMCDHFNWSVSRIESPTVETPEGFVAKIISRSSVVSKPGRGPELVDFLLEWREEIDMPIKPIISVSLGGVAGMVRVSALTESLQAVEDFGRQTVASPRYGKLVELTDGSTIRSVARITYINQP